MPVVSWLYWLHVNIMSEVTGADYINPFSLTLLVSMTVVIFLVAIYTDLINRCYWQSYNVLLLAPISLVVLGQHSWVLVMLFLVWMSCYLYPIENFIIKKFPLSESREVWAEDNDKFMEADGLENGAIPVKVTSFSSSEEAISFIKNKLDEQMKDIAQATKNSETLIEAYCFGGTNYFIKGDRSAFNCREYVQQQALPILEKAIAQKFAAVFKESDAQRSKAN